MAAEDACNIERRTFVRLPKEANVEYHERDHPLEDGKIHPARMKNVGAGGLLFESGKMIDVGRVLQLNIFFNNRHKQGDEAVSRPIIIIAEVIRSVEVIKGEKYDVGVRFVDIYEEDLERLLEFLEISNSSYS